MRWRDAASHTAGGTLFLVSRAGGNGALQSQPWRPDPDDGDARPEPAALGEVVQSLAPPPTAAAALLVPVAVGGAPVAVLVCAGRIRRARTADGPWHARVGLPVVPDRSSHGATPRHHSGRRRASGEDDGARRYARLLVSEIKLYNESAVRTGRERRDLLVRLRPEIDRARRLYEERSARLARRPRAAVPAGARADAGGRRPDPLGAPA